MKQVIFAVTILLLLSFNGRQYRNAGERVVICHKYDLTEFQETTALRFKKDYFPSGGLSAATTIRYYTYGCFDYRIESMHIEKINDDALITVAAADAKPVHCRIPWLFFKLCITRFNSSCFSLLEQHNSAAAVSNSSYSSGTVKKIEVEEAGDIVRFPVEACNPYFELKRALFPGSLLPEKRS